MPVVQNLLTDPGGQPIAGKTVTISLISGSTGGFIGSNDEVLSRTYATTDATGLWSATLAANATITPSGTYYTVTQLRETLSFVVPATVGPFWLHDILAVSPSSPPGLVIGDPLGAAAAAQAAAAADADTDVAEEAVIARAAEATKASTAGLTAEAATARAAEATDAGLVTAEAVTARAAEATDAGLVTTEATTARTAEAKAVPRWAPATAYTLGQQVVSPNNDVVSAIAAHTSGSTFTPANWALSSTYALVAEPVSGVETTNRTNADSAHVASSDPHGDRAAATAAAAILIATQHTTDNGLYALVAEPLAVKLAGDLAGTVTAPTVAKISGTAVGNAATKNVGTTTGTVAAGDDSRITGAATAASVTSEASTARTNESTIAATANAAAVKASNLSDLASAATSRTNLGLAAVASSGSATDLSTGTLADAQLPSTAQAATLTATYAPIDPNALTVGESTISRSAMSSLALVMGAAGSLTLTYFTATKSETITQVRFITGTVGAAAATLTRIGFYSIATNGNGTLVASTANDTTMLVAAFTRYTRSLSASYAKVAGQRYALGVLVVGATTMPTLPGVSSDSIENNTAPAVSNRITGLSDLPSTFLSATPGTAGTRFYAVVLP